MRIITVTYLNQNYGSLLQAYALQTALRQCGADPIILRQPMKQTTGLSIRKLRRLLKPKENYTAFQNVKLEIQRRQYNQKFEKLSEFIVQNIHVMDVHNIPEAIDVLRADDILLAGSDQIWSMIDHPLSKWYTFQWEGLPDEIKRYSYAASIGLSELNDEKIVQYRNALSQFETVSLREKAAYDLLAPCLTVPTQYDLDPTLLFDGDFWSKLAAERLIKEPYVFVYMLRPDKRLIEMAREIGKKKQCKVIYTGLLADSYSDIENICDAGIEEFLSYIKYADTIITNSFHGTVFSMLFDKNFVNVKISSTSSRAENLLEIAGLSDRMISDRNGLSILEKPINYKAAHSRIREKREQSLSYIQRICSASENDIPKYESRTKQTYLDSHREFDCRGCGACAAVCPVKAIGMKEKQGFTYPEIDIARCTKCGLCRRVCKQAENIPKSFVSADVFYGWNKNATRRWESTSGGAFPAIAEAWLQIHAQGKITGAVYDDSFRVKHICTDSIEGIVPMCRSKYVQSDLNSIFQEIRQLLNQQQYVLFSGTPCQVAGLLAFIGEENPYLFTVDFICHGVSNPLLFRQYIQSLGRQHGSEVISYSVRNKFRDASKSSYRLVRIKYADGSEQLTDRDPFIISYKYRLFYRKSCYGCIYASKKRCADITIGDFWGIENAIPNLRTERLAGISMIMLNSDKARSIQDNISRYMYLTPLSENIRAFDHLYLPTYSLKESPDIESLISSNNTVKVIRNSVTKKERFKYIHPHFETKKLRIKRRLYAFLR